ncbi:GFA family protein [Sphingomonas morindae]|uniref:GFA family protein n=1 Tax=Sphingomonas morindae TaxID=1541170 RepID=A0ABY4X925_9SPHN|nr:GFA family protein [Sphingomonas morindae]USI73421.1 GFA family protein [Sphingomonas morindae]
MRAHQGSCHCGGVQRVLRDDPAEAVACNGSICRRVAGLWHYCPPALVTVTGAGVAYRQGDRAIALWHCPLCGCTTHWTPMDPACPRMGINLGMLDPDVWQRVPRRLVDGASV